MVVDVGAEYDPATHRYDHHQRGFEHALNEYNFQTKLSSAGLVYKHFGKEILNELALASYGNDQERERLVDIVYPKVYKDFMEHIDAIDNGISICDSFTPKYHISTSLSARVGHLNPSWNDDNSPEIQNERFIQAMTLTCSEFIQCVDALFNVWWPAKSIVYNAVQNRLTLHESGQIILLAKACPWKDHIFEIEQEVNTSSFNRFRT